MRQRPVIAALQRDSMFITHGNDTAVIVQAHAAERGEHPAVFQLNKYWPSVHDLRDF